MSEKPGELAETVIADEGGTIHDDSIPPPGADGLAPGVLLAGRWELIALLGVGGMGSVYRARDRELDELVAVKVLRRELCRAPGMIERFRREVKLARRVTHPNVARTFDIGEAGELRFLTMELLDGAPLTAVLHRDRHITLPRLVPIARAICAGLGAAHDAGVVHRDLKPDNVIVERGGRVAITDFGIARALATEGAEGDTQGAVVGTPVYMAPEQIAHDAPIGPASDVYALGCMLFELATGTRPWRGPTPLAIAAARLLAPPPDPRVLRPDLVEGFGDLVMRMMARDPGHRPRSAAAVDEALASLDLRGGASSTTLVSGAARGGGAGPSSGSTPSTAPSSTTSSSFTPSSTATRGGGSTTPGLAWSAVKTLAVLPIENRSEAADAYLAAALTDDLVDLLSATSGVRVRPRAVAERAVHAGGLRDPRDVGRDLDVQVVVTGELRRQGDTLQASVRLVTVEDGFQLWARRFATPAADFLRIGDEAAAAIAEALLARPVAPRDAPDPEALDLYLRGRYLLQRTWGAAFDACDSLARAYALAPHDHRIQTLYARALVRTFSLGRVGNEAAVKATALIEEALQVDPRSTEARLARASLHLMRGEWVAGATDLRNVVDAAPDLEEAIAIVGDILVDCDAPTAAAVLERALVLDPGHFTPRVGLNRVAALEGDFARARRHLGEPPSDPFDRTAYWGSRARLAMWARDRDDARLVRDEHVVGPGTSFVGDVIAATTSATLGEPPPLRVMGRVTDALEGRAAPRIAGFHLQFRTEVLATFGLLDQAMSALVGADAQGTFDVRWIDRCPAIDPLRANPLFADVRERIAQRAERVRAALGELATTGLRAR